MQIKPEEIRPGDNLIFKRAANDKLALILSLIIKLFYPDWDMWGWHTCIVVWKDNGEWIVLEATWPVIDLKPLSSMGEFRAYRWFPEEPPEVKIKEFCKEYLGRKYDVLLYPWTAVQYLFRHFWNRPIPRLLDDRFTCWELVCEFDEAMGKPIISKYDCPILPDIQRMFS